MPIIEDAWDAVRIKPPAKPEWVEGNRFIKRVVNRERRDERTDLITLECGHWYAVISTTATHVRCKYCVRELTGFNPPDDPTPPRAA